MDRSIWLAAALSAAAAFACGGAHAQIAELISFGPLKGAGGGQTLSVTSSVNRTVESGATLVITASGDLFGIPSPGPTPDKSLTVAIDGRVIDVPFSFTPGEAPCATAEATVVIDQSVLAPLVADGSLTLSVTAGEDVAQLCDGAALTIEGSLAFDSSTLTETTTAAQSLAGSRAGVTLMNLPTFSTRLGGGGGSSVSGLGDGSGGAIAFSTSLSALREQAAKDSAHGSPAAFYAGAETGGVDVWVGGSYTYFETDVGGMKSDGDVGVLQAGLDYRLGEQALVGLFVMGDLLDGDAETGPDGSGLGFLTGPYAVFGLAENVHLEGVVAGGMAFNEIDSDGLPTADYESQRLLLSTRLSGDFRSGDWTFSPSTRVSYYVERQESFVDGSGADVPEDTMTYGQVRFGPEVAYDLDVGDGELLRPFAGVEGVWAFKQSDQVVNGVAVTPDELSATVALGVDASLGSTTLRAAGRYDGLGSEEFEAMTGELQLRVPLN